MATESASPSEADTWSSMRIHFLGTQNLKPAEILHPRTRCFRSILAGVISSLAILTLGAISTLRLHAQAPSQIVGRVEGRDFVIEQESSTPPTSIGPSGSVPTLLHSGSHLDVRTGQARILLSDGGEIVVCGPARIQLLKSQGALTVALDYGKLHIMIGGEEQLTFITPLIVATPVIIGGGPRETTIGLEQNGQMCLRASSGAVRVEQQLSGQSLLVPQLGQLSLSGGQMTTASPSAPGCACEMEVAKDSPSRPPVARDSVFTLNPTAVKPAVESLKTVVAPPLPPPNSNGASGAASQLPPDLDTPIYEVLMPALVFNSSTQVPLPDPSPQTIKLVRSVRVREDTVISGTIESNGKRNPQTLSAKADPNAQKPQPGFFARIGGFFRRVFGSKS